MLFPAVSRLLLVLVAGLTLTGCDLAQGIFKAGMGGRHLPRHCRAGVRGVSGHEGAPKDLKPADPRT